MHKRYGETNGQASEAQVQLTRKPLKKSLIAFAVLTPLSWLTLVQMQNTHALAATTGTWMDITNGASFSVPQGIAEDSAGDLFVVNMNTSTVFERFSGSKTWTNISNSGPFDAPSGIAVDNAGDVFVTNSTSNTVLERKSGTANWISITDGATFHSPTGIAVDTAGNLYVTNYANSEIMERKAGTKTWVNISGGGSFFNPFGIAVDTTGDLFVTNQAGPTPLLERKSGSQTWTTVPNEIAVSGGSGVTVDAKGDLFVAVSFGSAVLVLKNGSTQWITYSGGPYKAPTGITVDSANNLFVADQNQNKIYEAADVIVPNSPSQPAHSNVTQNAWTESWSSVSGATSYNVYVNGTKVNSSPVTTTNYNVTGEQAGTAYKVKVTAVNGGWQSLPSSVDTVTTLDSVPSAPAGLGHSSVTQTGWTESWPSVSGATSYNVYVNGTKVNSSRVTTTSYNVTGEKAGTSYKVTVTAVNTGGESAASTADTVTTVDSVPIAPAGLGHGSVTQTGWTESWSSVSGATSYNVYVNGTKVNSSPVTTTSYNVTGEKAGTSSKVTVTAVNTGGESAASTADTVTTLDNVPIAPAGLGHSSVTQTGWTESWSSVSGATSYNVYVNGTKVNSSPVTTTSYNVTGEQAGTAYKVTVTAVNTGGESAASAADSVTTLDNVPSAPVGLGHSGVTQTGWTESWSSVSGATSYNVYVNGTKVNSSPVTTTSYHVTGEKAGTSYKVTVTAVNTGGESAASAEDSVSTLSVLSVSTNTPLSSVLQGTGYNETIQALGGMAPYVFSLTSGSLPTGLTLQSNGQLAGTPSVNGNYDFTVRVIDKTGATATKNLSLYVIASAPAGFLPIVETKQVVGENGGTLTAKGSATTATLVVATGTFTNPLQMDVTSGTIPSSLVPNGEKVITAYGVNFDGQDAPSKPLTFTLINSGITPQSKVYKIVNGKLIPISAVLTQGKAVITFTTDPDFVVVQPQLQTKTVPGATQPVTGFGARPWAAGGLVSVLAGGLLLWRQRRRKHLEE